jgi:hypothetical protein
MFVDYRGGPLETPLGRLIGAGECELYPDGALKGVRLSAQNVVLTPSGPVRPLYVWDDPRRRYGPSLVFYPSGVIKSVRLAQRESLSLPLKTTVERLSWYENGALRHLFPLDGQLGPYWSERDERSLSEPITIDLGWLKFSALIISASFYPNQNLKSLTLWPGERVEVPTSLGVVEARLGLSFYPNGELKSLEPARGTTLKTPIGLIKPYDPSAIVLREEDNSLKFRSDGSLYSLAAMIEIEVKEGGLKKIFRPFSRPHYFVEGQKEFFPLVVRFEKDGIMVTGQGQEERAGKLILSTQEIVVRPVVGHLVGQLRLKNKP